ncbi:MAG: class I SAM-dependent methyltransferase [Rhodospirillales bacterium]|nr:class I SAM-dependent methyltransferase [Rhodospirillales bacterium]
MPEASLSDSAKQSDDINYFSNARRDALPLLNFNNGRVLEIGCGTGATLNFLKENGKISWAGGVEISPIAAEKAKETLDQIWHGNVENIDLESEIEEGALDAVLCMDVLEHLIDPWGMVGRLHKLLKPGGVLVANLPNIRYYKIPLGLLFNGKWKYEESGILDRTHLRFFVKDSMVELMECSGLKVDSIQRFPELKPWKNKWIYNKLTFGIFKEAFPTGYMLRAVKPKQ